MYTFLIEILLDQILNVLGLNSSTYKKINRLVKKSNEEGNLQVKIEYLNAILNEANSIIKDIQSEAEEKSKKLILLKNEADSYQKVVNMNQSDVDAITQIFNKSIERQSKKANNFNIKTGLFFCILSAILGVCIGKFI